MSELDARKLHLLKATQPQRPRQEASNVIVTRKEGPAPHESRVSVKSHTSESIHARGNLDSRVAQYQAVGSILAILRGFQVLRCESKLQLGAGRGVAWCAGRVTALFDAEVGRAETIISDARRLMEQFARKYPKSRIEISYATEVSATPQKS